jgi:N6-adenosine-specific RNA methylase IME4/ParB-like chromosome segregation protein Spo0J
MQRKFHSASTIFPLLEGEEFAGLVESIRAKGLLNPIWLHPDGSIIDGRNRYRACLEAGVEPHFQTWDGKSSLTDFVFAQNLDRRHLNATMRALAAKRAEPFFAREAKERQRAAGREFHRGKKKVSQRIDEPNENRAAARAAKIAKTNRQYVSDLKRIEREAPRVYARIEAGEIEIPEAKQEINKRERATRQDEIARDAKAGGQALPTGTLFPVILCDCPWEYDFSATQARMIENQYVTQHVDYLRTGVFDEPDGSTRDVRTLFARDAVIFFWATAPKLREAFQVLDAWGFTYRTGFVWDKTKIGMGYWVRGQHEHLLIATKGSFPPPDEQSRPASVISAARGAHSEKPKIVFQIIKKMFPRLPKLQLFGREDEEGWVTWGNQLTCSAATAAASRN